MSNIQFHKELNRSAIPFYREKSIDFFTETIKKWANLENFEPLIFSLSELKKSLGLEGSNNEKYFDDFILQFAKDTTISYQVGTRKITGNILSFVEDTADNSFTVKLNEDLKFFLFTKKDIELMSKAKNRLQLTVDELERYNKNREKYKNLMLYSQSELLSLRGKYNKRLYMLLIQFKKTGFFVMNYDEFKRDLDIPEKYRQCNIDEQILSKAKEDLLNANIQITDIKKIKKGRVIDRIEILFNYLLADNEPKDEIVIEDYEPLAVPDDVAEIGLKEIAKIRESLKR